MGALLRELFQKLQIVLEEQAQIIDPVTQHGHAVDAHAEGVTLPDLGIDARSVQHIGMNHAAAQNLKPSSVLAYAAAFAVAKHAFNVGFGGRLSKRKIGGPQPHPQWPL